MGLNYFVIPYGALLLLLPFIVLRGSTDRRLRPLLLGLWLTFLFGLGGTTPVPRLLLGRAYEVLTFERFTFWATLMTLPILGVLLMKWIDRAGNWASVPAMAAAVLTCALAVGWTTFRPINLDSRVDVEAIVSFLNREGHDQYRYLTLGFGSQLSKISTLTSAATVDGDYNSARTLPEMTKYGAAQLTNSKYYGIQGMESLKAMLRHADRYGLKWIFIRDRYYEPIVQFSGWRKVQDLNNGLITLWMKDDIPPAHAIPSTAVPPKWHGFVWGTLPIASSLFAIFAILLLPERKRSARTIQFPASIEPLPVTVQEARR